MIAIKDMEMPKSCKDCEFSRSHYEFGEYYSFCEFDKQAQNKLHEWLRNLLPADGKATYCPLVEIITCRDCKHKVFLASDGKGNTTYMCDRHCKNITNDAFYCANGERRE